MATSVEEFVAQINQLPAADRDELLRRLSRPRPANARPKSQNGTKERADPNTVWIKTNRQKYAGSYVALKDGELIASGMTIKEADLAAKARGVNDHLLHYILPVDYAPWGGW